MSFEVVQPNMKPAGLKPGVGSFTPWKSMIRLTRSDLNRIGVKDHITIMADRATRRIGFRAPRDGEKGVKLRPNKGSTTCVIFSANAAFKFLGIDAKKHGPSRFRVETKEDMLIVQLSQEAGK